MWRETRPVPNRAIGDESFVDRAVGLHNEGVAGRMQVAVRVGEADPELVAHPRQRTSGKGIDEAASVVAGNLLGERLDSVVVGVAPTSGQENGGSQPNSCRYESRHVVPSGTAVFQILRKQNSRSGTLHDRIDCRRIGGTGRRLPQVRRSITCATGPEDNRDAASRRHGHGDAVYSRGQVDRERRGGWRALVDSGDQARGISNLSNERARGRSWSEHDRWVW